MSVVEELVIEIVYVAELYDMNEGRVDVLLTSKSVVSVGVH